MPQLSDEVVEQFVQNYRDKGIDVSNGSVAVGTLKATQREINGEKVLGMKGAVENKGLDLQSNPIIVSADDYILDGHHRWATLLVLDPANEIAVHRVDLPIKQILEDAENFEGVEQQDFSGAAVETKEPTTEEVDLWETDIFEKSPEKVLGEPYQTTGRWGEVTRYKGDMSDLDKIQTPGDWKKANDPDSFAASIVETDVVDQEPVELSAKELDNIEEAIVKSQEDV